MVYTDSGGRGLKLLHPRDQGRRECDTMESSVINIMRWVVSSGTLKTVYIIVLNVIQLYIHWGVSGNGVYLQTCHLSE